MAEGQYYYCLIHKTVEPYDGCKDADRLGPYATREDAEHALDKVEQRNEAWDNDPKWNDDDDPDRIDDNDGGWAPAKS